MKPLPSSEHTRCFVLRYQYQGLMDATCATGRAWKGFHRRHSNFKASRDIGSGTQKPR